MLEKIPWRRKKKPFSAWQIELTTRCPLLCKMCIRSERDDWQFQDMPVENFKKILPYLKEVETVVLEGWGESLLHPHLIECVKRVKQEGAEVGFVTSGKGSDQGVGFRTDPCRPRFCRFFHRGDKGRDPRCHPGQLPSFGDP